eukprot:763615-Hanusia_phi.AAC.8
MHHFEKNLGQLHEIAHGKHVLASFTHIKGSRGRQLTRVTRIELWRQRGMAMGGREHLILLWPELTHLATFSVSAERQSAIMAALLGAARRRRRRRRRSEMVAGPLTVEERGWG